MAGCGRPLRGLCFRFPVPDGYVDKCGRCALLQPPLVRNGVKVAAAVGSLLTLINQGDVLARGVITPLVLVKIVLTYMVPYAVATYGALSVNRARR
ncbi:MAG TPA: nitrate/nitrite transporter NrtS [Bacillota bacterium]|nr:nitrate/nitrite transporter NrtS [Bacillota bacterium]